MPITVSDVKSVQYLLIVRAGLAVMEGSEKSIELLHSDAMLEFTTAVDNYRLSSSLTDLDKKVLLRTKNFLQSSCKPCDMHTGESIWRKFKDIRRYMANEMGPAYSRRLPGGQIPSGKSMEEMLLLVRKDLWELSESTTTSKSKQVKPVSERSFVATWYPVEWLAFMAYGLASSNPADFFRVRESNGPSKSTSDATVAPIKKSRKEQRKVQRTKDQEVRHALVKIPSKEEKRDKKERKVSSNHTAAMKYSFALEARKETIKELQLLKDLEDDPVEKAVAKENLVTFLKTPKPVLEIVETSGKFETFFIMFIHHPDIVFYFNTVADDSSVEPEPTKKRKREEPEGPPLSVVDAWNAQEQESDSDSEKSELSMLDTPINQQIEMSNFMEWSKQCHAPVPDIDKDVSDPLPPVRKATRATTSSSSSSSSSSASSAPIAKRSHTTPTIGVAINCDANISEDEGIESAFHSSSRTNKRKGPVTRRGRN